MKRGQEKAHADWSDALFRQTDAIDALLQAARKMNEAQLRSYRNAAEDGVGEQARLQEKPLLDAAREYVEVSNALDTTSEAYARFSSKRA